MWRRGAARADSPPAPRVSPGVVTALLPAARRPGRWELTVDGSLVGLVSVDMVEQFALRVGRVLDEGSAAALADGIDATAVYDRALGLLAARGRSSRDLQQRLVRGGASPAHAAAAVTRLQDAGLLDDAAYARQVARSRVAGRGDSRRRVALALTQAGVARPLADEAVADVFEEEAVDETALVEAAARKRVRSLGGLDDVTRRRRLYGFLARRGHDAALIREVLGRVLGAGGDEADGDAPDGDDATDRALREVGDAAGSRD